MKLDVANPSIERRLRNTLTPLLMTGLFGYLAFIPFGPYPIYVFGCKLDYIFVLLVFLLCVLLFPFKWPKKTKPVLVGILIFLAVSFVSTILADSDLTGSKRGFETTVIYAAVTLIVPVLTYRNARQIRYFVMIAALFAGGAIIYAYFFRHFGDYGRMKLALIPRESLTSNQYDEVWVDPNMTAIGLFLCVVVFFHEYLTNTKTLCDCFYKILFFLVSVAVITVSVLLLLSRTAMISFFVSILWATCYLIVFKVRGRGGVMIKIGILGLAFIFGLSALYHKRPLQVETFYNRITRLASKEFVPTELERIRLANESIERWLQSPKTFLVGQGYFTTNPHNEFLRMLSGSGLLGLSSFVLVFFSIYTTCCTSKAADPVYLFSQNALFAYIFCAIQFYGHTKSMWVALMFLLMNFLWQEYSLSNLRKR